MDTLKDIASSLRDWFKERVGNPLFASFIIAWLTINWRVVLIVSSQLPAQEKIKWLDYKLYPLRWHWPVYGFIMPLFVASLYVAISPFILRKVSVYYREQQHKSALAILSADKIKPLSPDQALKLVEERITARQELKIEKARFSTLESDYLDQIDTLQKNLDSLFAKGLLNQQVVESEIEKKASYDFTPDGLNAASMMSHQARLLLKKAADDNKGLFHLRSFIGGKSLIVNGENLFGEKSSARTVAEWENSIQELQSAGLVERIGEGMYKVTKTGYDASDAIE